MSPPTRDQLAAARDALLYVADHSPTLSSFDESAVRKGAAMLQEVLEARGE